MFLLILFVELIFEMVLRQRSAIYSLSRRLTMQSHLIARQNHRLRMLEREYRRATTEH